jgi:HPt (histidine-containing phosphotransfer) domain-containing protein
MDRESAKNEGVSSLNQKFIGELREIERAGSPGFLGELIDLFLQEAVAHLAGLRKSLAAKDARAFERTAHTLKGSSGNLGATAMSMMCAVLQEIGRETDWTRAEELLPRLETEFQVVKADLLVEKERP